MSQLVPTIYNTYAADMDFPNFYDPLLDFDIDHKMLDGLTGVPTRTTSTLTPTTLRNIEQTFIDLQCQEESHQNQAGFVPPVVQPVSHGTGNSLFMSLIDHKSWGGGSAVVGDSHSSNDSTLSITPPATIPTTTTRRNMGGRRPIKDKNISPEEEERRQIRRERNKLAAARCRKRRLDHTNELLEETEGLEDKKQSLQQEIQQLQMAKEDLEFILEAHKSTCRLKRSDSPPDVKPFSLNANKMLLGGMQVKLDPDASEAKRPRPTSLPGIARKIMNVPTSEVAGVPIVTPTTGMPFNFDSLMEGGTGLTPVSGPLIPSCATQQRSGCVDLPSPNTLPTKLVSL